MNNPEILPLFAEFVRTHLDDERLKIEFSSDLPLIETSFWSGSCQIIDYNNEKPGNVMVGFGFKMLIATELDTPLIDTTVGLCPTWQEAVLEAGHSWLQGMYQVIHNYRLDHASTLMYHKKPGFLRKPARWKLFESLVRIRG